jgi:dUTP pyrophosphatase
MGNILVRYDNDIDKHLQFAMAGDVGLDLPIRIAGSKVQPVEFSHLIKPDGDDQDEVPWLEVPPGGFAEIESGIRVKVPEDAWALITGRSSTAWKRRLMVQQGVIDSGYIGYLKTLVYNPNRICKRVHEGDRLAQLIVIPKYKIDDIITVDELPETARSDNGFGSTGI